MADVLGTFEQAVLLAVVRLDDAAYGRAILKEVQTRLDREVAAGAVHATLTRLEQKGFLVSRLGPGTEVRAGRPRRFYRVSPTGRRALNDARAVVDKLWRGFRWPQKGYS
jgi:PadR family transcriptional regulator PadR